MNAIFAVPTVTVLWYGSRKAARPSDMNLHKMIEELRVEKQRLDDAIVALERLSAGSATKIVKRRPRSLRWTPGERAQPIDVDRSEAS